MPRKVPVFKFPPALPLPEKVSVTCSFVALITILIESKKINLPDCKFHEGKDWVCFFQPCGPSPSTVPRPQWMLNAYVLN